MRYNSATAKVLAATGVVTTAGSPGWLCSYCMKIGTADTTITFKDGGTSGTARWVDGWNGQTAAGEVFVRHTFNPPIRFDTDIYATFAGTGANSCSVAYIEDLVPITAV